MPGSANVFLPAAGSLCLAFSFHWTLAAPPVPTACRVLQAAACLCGHIHSGVCLLCKHPRRRPGSSRHPAARGGRRAAWWRKHTSPASASIPKGRQTANVLLAIPAANIPPYAVGGALLIVGALMVANVAKIPWDRIGQVRKLQCHS